MNITPEQMIALIKNIDGSPFNYGRIQRIGFQTWTAKFHQICTELPWERDVILQGVLEDMVEDKMIEKSTGHGYGRGNGTCTYYTYVVNA
jgi:hypothetical protein